MANKGTPLSQIYKRNLSLEDEGVWIELVEGLSVKIRSAGSKKARAYAKKLYAPLKHKIRKGQLGEEKALDLATSLLAEAIILDWEGFYDDDGKEIPFSPKAAKELLSDEAYSDLLKDIDEASGMRETFLADEAEDDSKNSKKTSAGS